MLHIYCGFIICEKVKSRLKEEICSKPGEDVVLDQFFCQTMASSHIILFYMSNMSRSWIPNPGICDYLQAGRFLFCRSEMFRFTYLVKRWREKVSKSNYVLLSRWNGGIIIMTENPQFPFILHLLVRWFWAFLKFSFLPRVWRFASENFEVTGHSRLDYFEGCKEAKLTPITSYCSQLSVILFLMPPQKWPHHYVVSFLEDFIHWRYLDSSKSSIKIISINKVE